MRKGNKVNWFCKNEKEQDFSCPYCSLSVAFKNDDEIWADELGSEHTPAMLGIGVHNGGSLFLHTESRDGLDFVFLPINYELKASMTIE